MASLSTDQSASALAQVEDLEAALRASQKLARDLKQDLDYYVYAASHDLQEPLRAVRSYAELLQRRHPEDAETKEFALAITDGVKRMTGLLHNLLAYSRIHPMPPLKTLRLDAALPAVLFKLAPVIQTSGAVITYGALPEITAFEPQIAQLLEQILTNSIIFRSLEKPKINITPDEGEIAGETVAIIRIQDNGCGMEAQYLAQVLTPFKRLHSKEYPGDGLGLAICDKVMRAHHGKIWIESEGPQKGITVCLAFPI